MIRYEFKKVYSKTSSKIAVVILFLLLGITCYLAVHGVGYVNEEGKTEYGVQAVQKLKAERKEWAGVLSEEVIARVIEENAKINATEEAQSNNLQKNEIAFSWKQGFYDIRNMLVRSFCAFRDYDYYVPDSLTPADAKVNSIGSGDSIYSHFYPLIFERKQFVNYVQNTGSFAGSTIANEYSVGGF